MVLSDNAVSQLVACTRRGFGEGDARVRAAAREAVTGAARELGFDAKAPPIPDFAGGEDSLTAACRLLKLTRADRAVEEYRARRDVLAQVTQRYAALHARRQVLLQEEAGRLYAAVAAGRVPERSPRKARDELAAVQLELDLAPNMEDLAGFYPEQPEQALREQALEPDQWLAVVLYMHLLRDSLLVLTEDEKPGGQARTQAEGAAMPAIGYEKTANVRMGQDQAAQEHYVAVRAVRIAVEVADLHNRLARERRRHERERTIEELELARAGR